MDISMYELTGLTFGKWLVKSETIGTKTSRKWLCVCACGKSKVVWQEHLIHGKSTSCGCSRKDRPSRKTHGQSRLDVYGIWNSMIQRCGNPKNTSYYCYGKRGITVCDRWRNSFENFIADMGKRPTSQHQIDRINNNGNYEPSNCRWATQIEQSRNSRNCKLTFDQVYEIRKLRGEGLKDVELANKFNISKTHVRAIYSGRSWNKF